MSSVSQIQHDIIHANPRNERQRAIDEANPDLLLNLRLYVFEGSRTGDFLQAVIADSLTESVLHADRASMSVLGGLALYCYHDMPSVARGSWDAYQQWTEEGGLIGRHDNAEEAAEYAEALGI